MQASANPDYCTWKPGLREVGLHCVKRRSIGALETYLHATFATSTIINTSSALNDIWWVPLTPAQKIPFSDSGAPNMESQSKVVKDRTTEKNNHKQQLYVYSSLV